MRYCNVPRVIRSPSGPMNDQVRLAREPVAICGLCDQLEKWKSTAKCFSVLPIQLSKSCGDSLLPSSCSLALDCTAPRRDVDAHYPLIRRVAPPCYQT
jgi:hypothetical protein